MNSRSKIVKAAIKVFSAKGKHGARMEEIATEAKINKAMVYYYFSNRENLYFEVLTSIFIDIQNYFANELKRISPESVDFKLKLERIIKAFFKLYSDNPEKTTIMLAAFANEPETIHRVLQNLQSSRGVTNPIDMLAILRAGISKDAYRNIDPTQIIISIIGINLAHFIAGPIMPTALAMSKAKQRAFLKHREKSITDLVLYGLISERYR